MSHFYKPNFLAKQQFVCFAFSLFREIDVSTLGAGDIFGQIFTCLQVILSFPVAFSTSQIICCLFIAVSMHHDSREASYP